MITTFDDDRAKVNAAVDSLKTEGSSAARVLQSIAAAAAMIQATRAPCSAVVVISATDPGTPTEAGVELLAPIVDSRAAVHVIAKASAGDAGAAGTLNRHAPDGQRADARPVHRRLFSGVLSVGAGSPRRSSLGRR